jgi:hypothetical protein
MGRRSGALLAVGCQDNYPAKVCWQIGTSPMINFGTEGRLLEQDIASFSKLSLLTVCHCRCKRSWCRWATVQHLFQHAGCRAHPLLHNAAVVRMARRVGDQTFSHHQAPVSDRHTRSSQHSQQIGLSARFKDQHVGTPKHRVSKQALAKERAHSRYPFSRGVFWFSVFAFISFVLASLYWVTYFASTS